MTNNTTADTTARGAGEIEPVAWVERTDSGLTRMWSGDLSAWANRPASPEPLYSQATVDTLRAQLEAAEAEVSGMRARMFYLATDGCVEGFVHVNRDVYDFASEMAELAAREEPNDDDLIDGFCQLIDAAQAKAATP